MMDRKPPLLLTLGDPNGVGPELVCRLPGGLDGPGGQRPLILIGPEQALIERCHNLEMDPFWERIGSDRTLDGLSPGIYLRVPKGLEDWKPQPGKAVVHGGQAAGMSLDLACSILLAAQAGGVVTCPLNKAMLHRAGYNFPGHTEFLARRSGLGPDEVCMVLAGDILRVGLATTHPRLKDVPGLLNVARIQRCVRLMWDFVSRLDAPTLPIGVCGLNPHAGEQGDIGDEEITTIAPAIEAVRRQGVSVSGPWPADSLFYRAYHGEFSAILAMYHDQGLAPLKLVHFQEAVNVTLGLPFVRTSVDHGTAYELVGTGRAGVHSLSRALALAERLMRGSSG